MAWENAFAKGACVVTVYRLDVQVYQGSMRLGDSAEIAVGAEELWVISVSGDGVVSLDGLRFGSVGGYAAVYVIPSSSAVATRISGIVADVGDYGTQVALGSGSYEESTWDVPLSRSGSSWIPDPCDIPSGAPAIGLYAEAAAV